MERGDWAPQGHEHPLLPREVQGEFRRLGYWEPTTLADIVEGWADRDPSRIAITGPTQLTYGELWEQARRLGGSLQRYGLSPGDYLLAVLPSCWQGIVLQVAVSVAGAALAARSTHVSPTLALNTFEQLNARGLVLQADLLQSGDWRAILAQISDRLPKGVVMLQGEPGANMPSLPMLERAAVAGPLASKVAHAPCQPCLVLSTGGTTGRPKSIMHCSETLVYAAREFAAACDFTENDVHVAFAPYGHAQGSVFEVYMPLLVGASILPNTRWRARPVAEAIDRYGGTFFITMGTHIFDLLALEPEMRSLLRSVRLVTSGAGPDSLFVDGEQKLGFKIVRVYGCSECPGHAVGQPGDPAEVRLQQDGIPFPGIEHRILDTSGKPVPNGKSGEYQCRGPNLFMGYAGEPELTSQAVTEDGFYRSGDLMIKSPEGYVNWQGRTKDIIRRGGLQIDPIEMEEMLDKHPKVSQVVVVGEPDPRLGERAAVVAVPTNHDDPPTLDELVAHLKALGLPKQSLPERLMLTDDIPRTELGKFHRVEVKRRVAQEAERGVEQIA
jgi:acyl-coenzyme A synthetase/AMP-(fatty) acid ligase